MPSPSRPCYSRAVSRVAAGPFDTYIKRTDWRDSVLIDSHQKSLTCSNANNLENALEIIALHNGAGAAMNQKPRFDYTNKEPGMFECDAEIEQYGFHVYRVSGQSPGVISDISDEKTENSAQKQIAPASPSNVFDPNIPSSQPTESHNYRHPLHRALSSTSGELKGELSPSPRQEGSCKAPTSEPTNEPTVAMAAADEQTSKKRKKKKKGGAKRKPKHTGKKHADRLATAVVATPTAATSFVTPVSNGSDRDPDTNPADVTLATVTLAASSCPATPAPANTIMSTIVTTITTLSQTSDEKESARLGIEKVTDSTTLISQLQAYDRTESAGCIPSAVPDRGILVVCSPQQPSDLYASPATQSSPTQHPKTVYARHRGSRYPHTSDFSRLVGITAEEWQEQEENFADDENSPGEATPSEFFGQSCINSAEELSSDSNVELEPRSIEWHEEGRSLSAEQQQSEGTVGLSTQWNSPYPDIPCKSYSICAWQPACLFHKRKVGCGCWYCPLPQRSCCCAHVPLDCVYRRLPPGADESEQICSWSAASRGAVWRGPFTYRQPCTSLSFTAPQPSIPFPQHSSTVIDPSTHSPFIVQNTTSTNIFDSDPSQVPTMTRSTAEQMKRRGRPQPAIPLLNPRGSKISKPKALDEATPTKFSVIEQGKQSGSISNPFKSTHVDSSVSPVVIEDTPAHSIVMPSREDTQETKTIILAPNDCSNEKNINTDISARSFAERRSYAQIARLAVDAELAVSTAEHDLITENDKESPSVYFDARQSLGSSTGNSGSLSKSSSKQVSPDSAPRSPVHPQPSTAPFTQASGDLSISLFQELSSLENSPCNRSAVSKIPGMTLRFAATSKVSSDTVRDEKDRNFEQKPQISRQISYQGSSNTASIVPQVIKSPIGTPGPSLTDGQMQSPPAPNSLNRIDILRGQFGIPDYSDIQILVGFQEPQTASGVAPGSNYEVFYVHAAILDSSPFLHQVMHTGVFRHDDGLHYIHANVGPSFNVLPAFSMALQSLYGTPLITPETLSDVVVKSTSHTLSYNKKFASFKPEVVTVYFSLCYAVSGNFLNMAEVTKRGMELATGLLAWNTVEVFLHFGMAASTFMISCPELDGIATTGSPTTTTTTNTGEACPPKVSLKHVKEFEEAWPGSSLAVALEFIANAIHGDFAVYERAQREFSPSRIPDPLWTLPMNSRCTDPRLESICFGSMPSFAQTAPTDKAVLVASAALLTLPFGPFIMLLDILKRRGMARVELVQEVVRLREGRRISAVHRYQRQVWPPGVLHDSALQEIAYREVVIFDEESEGGTSEPGVSVRRDWVGLRHPRMAELQRTFRE